MTILERKCIEHPDTTEQSITEHSGVAALRERQRVAMNRWLVIAVCVAALVLGCLVIAS